MRREIIEDAFNRLSALRGIQNDEIARKRLYRVFKDFNPEDAIECMNELSGDVDHGAFYILGLIHGMALVVNDNSFKRVK